MREMTRPIAVLTKRLFKQNKGRDIVAVTAVALTTLLFTTLFVLSLSMSKNLVEMTFRQTGYDAQVSFKSITSEQIEKIASHPDVAEVGESIVVGMGTGTSLAGRQVELRFADESYALHSFALPETGRMPQNKDEIALDTIVLDRLGIPHELGQQVSLEWTADFRTKTDRVSEFTLCGFWEGNESSYASMAWVDRSFLEEVMAEVKTYPQGESAEAEAETELQRDAAGAEAGTEPQRDTAEAKAEMASQGDAAEAKTGTAQQVDSAGEKTSVITGIHMAQVTLCEEEHIEQTMDRILADTGLTGLEYGVNLAYDPDLNRMKSQESLPMYLGMFLVFAAGYLIIYNIFQISVTADIQFYGRLKTLGMTARQLKKLVYGQAALLCIPGIFTGMAPGYLLGAVLVPVLVNMPFASVSASPLIFIGSALFAAATVLISCMRPAKMAGRVSPVEALRYNDVQNMGRSFRKKSGSTKISALAWSNLGRNKKRTVTVVCSLTFGLVLMSAFYAKNAAFDMEKYLSGLTVSDFQIDDASSEEYIAGYDPYSDTLNKELTDKVNNLEGLEETGYLYSHDTQIQLDEQAISNLQGFYTQEKLDYWGSYDPAGPKSLQNAIEQRQAGAVIYGTDGIVLDAYTAPEHVQKGSVDMAEFGTGRYAFAIAPSGEEEEVLPTVSVGEDVVIEGRSYTVMAVLDDINPVTEGAYEDGITDQFFLDFILPLDTFRENWPQNTPRKLFFNVDDAHMEAAQKMLDAHMAETGSTLSVTSRASMSAQYDRETRSSAVMGNVVGSVIALVGVLNFVNSMVTSIVARKKEFAMMQSVGMTKKQLCRLLMYEGMAYACSTLFISYMLSALVVGVGVRAMVEGGFTTFRFTLLPLVLCTPVLLAFALLVPYICFRNIEKVSLVDRLRTDCV